MSKLGRSGNHLDSIITNHSMCTKEIKTMTAMVKIGPWKKKTFITDRLHVSLRLLEKNVWSQIV